MPLLPKNSIQQTIGDIGETEAALRFKKWKWTADIIKSDFGEDLSCNIFIDTLRTNLYFRCQVKSTCNPNHKSYIRKLKSGNYSVSIDSKTLKAWLFSYFPILLIIYDDNIEELFWADPVSQIKDRLQMLSQESITIHLNKENKLKSDRVEIENLVREYYAKLLKLQTNYIRCTVFPVIMPGYKLIPYKDFYNNLNILRDTDLVTVDSSFRYTNTLPAWMTLIKTLEPTNFLSCYEVKYSGSDLGIFVSSIKSVMSCFKYKLEKDEWISFVCSSIEMACEAEQNDEYQILKKELTGWWGFSVINSNVISEPDYTFQIPKDFFHQSTRRARSWEYFHHVSPDLDLAIQLFGSVGISPSYINFNRSLEESIKRQYIVWECSSDEIDDLEKLLLDTELVYRIIPEFSNEEKYIGIVCKHMFEPFLGLTPTFMDWNEFEKGVLGLVQDSKNNFIIPGRQPSIDIVEKIVRLINEDSIEATEHLITQKDYCDVIPINLKDRWISIHRYRIDYTYNLKFAKDQLELLKNEAQCILGDGSNVITSVEEFETGFGEKVIELRIEWNPSLFDSSKDSFEKIKHIILRTFDTIFDRKILKVKNFDNCTLDVLRFYGEVDFRLNDKK